MVKPPVLHVAVFEVDTNVDADEAISRVHGAGYMGITVVHKRERTAQRLQARSLHNAASLPCGVATERGTVVQAGHASGLQEISQKKADGATGSYRPDDVAVNVHQVRSDIQTVIAPRGPVRMVARDVDGVLRGNGEAIRLVHVTFAGRGGAAVAEDLLLFHCGDHKHLAGPQDQDFLRHHGSASDVVVVPEFIEVCEPPHLASHYEGGPLAPHHAVRTERERGVVTVLGHSREPASTATADCVSSAHAG